MDNKMTVLNEKELEKVDGGILLTAGAITVYVLSTIVFGAGITGIVAAIKNLTK